MVFVLRERGKICYEVGKISGKICFMRRVAECPEGGVTFGADGGTLGGSTTRVFCLGVWALYLEFFS